MGTELKCYVGIGLNLFNARAVLLRQDGKIIAEIEKDRSNVNANETIEVLLELFSGILDKAKKHTNDIKSVGLALGGIVNSSKGIVYWPQKQQSSYVYISLPLRDYLEKKFGFPVFIENDANACALAEVSLSFPKNKNLLYMFSGVGCGIIAAGKVYRGKDGKAGELFLKTKPVMNSTMGNFSFFQQWPIDLDMAKRAKEFISMGHNSTLLKKITSTGELALSDIFIEAEKKDNISRQVLKEGAYSLGVKIAFLVNLLNPEVVVIGGGMEKAGEYFLQECEATIKSFSFSEMGKDARIVLSGLGKTATSLGAAILAMRGNSDSDN